MESYDLIVVGTGFASSFLLKEFLRTAGPKSRVLVLERGKTRDRAWQLLNRSAFQRAAQKMYINKSTKKIWKFTSAFGGSSNCWVGCTPRMTPSDFEMKSRFGIAVDWPISYAELEPYYCEVEDALSVSGPDNTAIFPRSKPYPLAPHRMSHPDKALALAFPRMFFSMPTARASRATNNRPKCCASSVCQLCPIDAKATVLNSLSDIYKDQRVTLLTEAYVEEVMTSGNVAHSVKYKVEGSQNTSVSGGSIIALGANALFNAGILLRSGITELVGRGLVEQASSHINVHLDGMASMQGSTAFTGHGYMLHTDEHRDERAAVLLETSNRPVLRSERGKWRMGYKVKAIYEDLRMRDNRVTIDPRTGIEIATFSGPSEYTRRTQKALKSLLKTAFASLPVERISIGRGFNKTESHIMGTVPMGTSREDSVVDAELLHHKYRNLMVLGASAFPTAAPANPTLTLSALSVRAGRKVFSK